jgi:hypothetical protein
MSVRVFRTLLGQTIHVGNAVLRRVPFPFVRIEALALRRVGRVVFDVSRRPPEIARVGQPPALLRHAAIKRSEGWFVINAAAVVAVCFTADFEIGYL